MNKLSISLVVTCAVLVSSQAIANDHAKNTPTAQQLISALDKHFANTPTAQQLILALDTKELARHLNRQDTYTSLFDPKGFTAKPTLAKVDSGSKRLKKAGKAFKRFSSIRTGKHQKIRAKIRKTSLTLKYTRVL